MSKKPCYIAMDVHCQFVEGGWIDPAGNELGSFRCPTAIPELLAWVEKVPHPRILAIEEGPLADWLARNLSPAVDKLICCSCITTGCANGFAKPCG